MVRAQSRRAGSAASGAVRSRTRFPAKSDDAEARLALYDEVYKEICVAIGDFIEFRACSADMRETDARIDVSKKKKKKEEEEEAEEEQ